MRAGSDRYATAESVTLSSYRCCQVSPAPADLNPLASSGMRANRRLPIRKAGAHHAQAASRRMDAPSRTHASGLDRQCSCARTAPSRMPRSVQPVSPRRFRDGQRTGVIPRADLAWTGNPVRKAERDGTQSGDGQYAFSNVTPRSARPWIAGVLHEGMAVRRTHHRAVLVAHQHQHIRSRRRAQVGLRSISTPTGPMGLR